MKKTLLVAVLVLSAQSVFAGNGFPLLRRVREAVCKVVVAETKKSSYDLKKYTVQSCLKNADITARVGGNSKAGYVIDMNDTDIRELKGTDLWLACELTMEGTGDATKGIELSWCSIEQ